MSTVEEMPKPAWLTGKSYKLYLVYAVLKWKHWHETPVSRVIPCPNRHHHDAQCLSLLRTGTPMTALHYPPDH